MPRGRRKYIGPRLPSGKVYSRTGYNPPVSKSVQKFVKKEIKKAEYSKEQITVIDFDVASVGTVNKYTLSNAIMTRLLGIALKY